MKIEINYTDEELQNEIWKPIPFFEGLYEASNLGRLRTCENKTTYTKRHGIRHWQQRILKPKYCVSTCNQHRLDGRVELWKDGKHKTYLVSRLVLLSFKGNNLLDIKLTVNHIDNNSLNNKIENLEWCSLKENIQKGFETGAYPTCKRTLLIDKRTNEKKIFRSMSLAGKYINQSEQYISNKIRKNSFENQNYKWEIIKN